MTFTSSMDEICSAPHTRVTQYLKVGALCPCKPNYNTGVCSRPYLTPADSRRLLGLAAVDHHIAHVRILKVVSDNRT